MMFECFGMRDIEQWLQKVNLEQLILEYRTLIFKEINFLEKTSLFGKLPFLSP